VAPSIDRLGFLSARPLSPLHLLFAIFLSTRANTIIPNETTRFANISNNAVVDLVAKTSAQAKAKVRIAMQCGDKRVTVSKTSSPHFPSQHLSLRQCPPNLAISPSHYPYNITNGFVGDLKRRDTSRFPKHYLAVSSNCFVELLRCVASPLHRFALLRRFFFIRFPGKFPEPPVDNGHPD
jgi:hypothetical protein